MPDWSIAAFTHRGRVRPTNEDTLAVHTQILSGDMGAPFVSSISSDCCVLMIADGMGGHVQGAMASRAVLDYLVAAIDRLADPSSCAELIEEANRHLFELMSKHEEAVGMGTTLVGAVLKSDQLITFNVGDSRCYLHSGGQLIQLSHDDIPEQAKGHPGRRRSNALTQALGGSSLPMPVTPHITIDAPLAAGEPLLLCSDGLTDMVVDSAIRGILSGAPDPAMAVRHLAARALEVGGRDNISLVAVRLSEGTHSA